MRIRLVTSALAMLLVSPVSEAATLICDHPSIGRQDRLPISSVGAYKASDINNGAMDRVGRAFKFGLEIKDTPDFLTGDVEVPVRDSMGNETGETRPVLGFLSNPDERLLKGTAEINVGRFFNTSSELKALFSTIAGHKSVFDLSADPLASEPDKLKYFKRTRSKDWGARLLSTMTLKIGVSERPSLDPTLPLTDAFRRFVEMQDESEESYSLKFDPAPLFNSGAHLSAAAAALTSYSTTYKPVGLAITSLCSARRPSCLSDVSGVSGGRKWLLALLPVFEVKTVDQFDFLQYNGRPLRSIFVEDQLETFTLTWDLNRAFDRQAERTATLAAIEAVEKLTEGPPVIKKPGSTAVAAGSIVYRKIGVDKGVQKLGWKVIRSSCKNDANAKSEAFHGVELQAGLLVGYPELKQASWDCDLTIAVEDALGRVDRLDCEIR